ncbi:hypothetical protein [Magnetospirillum sp. UT-4]|uniref:hypothetical protein n=1 Tax=Magnetospirillum sp. UT-4 TaxID=2681467 RepID=UPI00137F019B|nr:hypothetical protein [Magnetospirillum sp. UT-4]CAA7626432.1 putative Esterase [Magnetospirillum sp. UT-4]
MLKNLAAWLAPPPIRTPEDLAGFIATESARVAQKATTGYCRTKAGANHDLLFKEAGFLAALDECRWSAYGLVAADICLVAEGFLRPAAAGAGEEALAAWVLAVYDGMLDAQPHPGRGPEGWSAEKAEMRARLARSRMAEPIPPANVGFDTARRIFDSLPVHPSLRREDFEVVQNLMRFGHVTFFDELSKRADKAAIVAALHQDSP